MTWAMVIVILLGLVMSNLGSAQLHKKILEAWHTRFSEDGKATRAAMLTAVEMMRDVRNSCDGCRIEVLATINNAMGAQVERVLMDNRIEHEDTRACMYELHKDVGREEDRTVAELKTINQTLLALFPQGDKPSVGGTGSAVRDSVAAGK